MGIHKTYTFASQLAIVTIARYKIKCEQYLNYIYILLTDEFTQYRKQLQIQNLNSSTFLHFLTDKS